jgi:hypothetical protein
MPNLVLGAVGYFLKISGQTLPIRNVAAKNGNTYGEIRSKRADGEISGQRGVSIAALAETLPTMATLCEVNADGTCGAEVFTIGLNKGMTTVDMTVPVAKRKAPRPKVSGSSEPFESIYGDDRVVNVQVSENAANGTWYLYQCGVRGVGGGGVGVQTLDSL